MSCRGFERHLGAFRDGELDAALHVEFERHLEECSGCRDRLKFEDAFRAWTREALGTKQAPNHLRDRVQRAVRRAPLPSGRPRWGGWSVPGGLGTPATVAAMVASLALLLVVPPWSLSGVTHSGMVPLLEDVVRLHSSELPADVQGPPPQRITRYFRGKVEFPVRPAVFRRGEARLVGARLSNVHAHRAAALYYRAGDRRLTVVVFDEPSSFDRGILRARLAGREVRYQTVHGYTVPVRRHAGLTYAFTGDLDKGSLLRLAASADVEP